VSYQIVVGVDGSPHSIAALRWSLDQAGSRGGSVRAVLAWQVPFVSIPGAFDRAELEQGYREFLIRTVSERRAWSLPPRPPPPTCWSWVSAAGRPSPG
jgi:hypothetical protein